MPRLLVLVLGAFVPGAFVPGAFVPGAFVPGALLPLAPFAATSASARQPDALGHEEGLCKKHEAKGPCTTKQFDFERIEKACEEKGRRGAASAMRMMMLRANQKRADLKCASCHEDPDEGHYALLADARKLAKKHFTETAAAR